MKTIVAFSLLAVLVAGGFVFFSREVQSPAATDVPSDLFPIDPIGDTGLGASVPPQGAGTDGPGAMEETEKTAISGALITYTDTGYSPTRVEINTGDRVTFVNKSSAETWPASNIHPTHTLYPESDIKKCFDGSDGAALFDACHGLKADEEWSFVFTETGIWDYHDHMHPRHTGTIVVK